MDAGVVCLLDAKGNLNGAAAQLRMKLYIRMEFSSKALLAASAAAPSSAQIANNSLGDSSTVSHDNSKVLPEAMQPLQLLSNNLAATNESRDRDVADGRQCPEEKEGVGFRVLSTGPDNVTASSNDVFLELRRACEMVECAAASGAVAASVAAIPVPQAVEGDLGHTEIQSVAARESAPLETVATINLPGVSSPAELGCMSSASLKASSLSKAAEGQGSCSGSMHRSISDSCIEDAHMEDVMSNISIASQAMAYLREEVDSLRIRGPGSS